MKEAAAAEHERDARREDGRADLRDAGAGVKNEQDSDRHRREETRRGGRPRESEARQLAAGSWFDCRTCAHPKVTSSGDGLSPAAELGRLFKAATRSLLRRHTWRLDSCEPQPSRRRGLGHRQTRGYHAAERDPIAWELGEIVYLSGASTVAPDTILEL